MSQNHSKDEIPHQVPDALRPAVSRDEDLQTIFDTTETIYVLLDGACMIASYNLQAVLFVKNETGLDIECGNHIVNYFPPETREMLMNCMNASMKGESVRCEVSFQQPDKTQNWYYWRLFPIIKNNEPQGIMMEGSNITDKKNLEQRLSDERSKRHMEITDAVITAEENERQVIGLELHDNVNQVLASARLYLGMALNEDGSSCKAMVSEADRLIGTAINEIRNLSHSLISPFIEEFGIIESIDYLVETVSKSSHLRILKEVTIDERTIDKKLGLAIYRILQEQLTNILKHANATVVLIGLIQEHNKLTLCIKDNGIGFQRSRKYNGIGLMNIKTRASLFNGNINIISSPGKGCELVVTFMI